ncbi:Transcription factor zinc-finger [Stigmatella erecta]|uniref:Transcription factor zinc-finger n=2 Tax=Stigmatella erecta TaxID=83460 RepID=A0A1I0L565_9BACT|nr:Transcription factor zinc-finger [Stigmatella erecta]
MNPCPFCFGKMSPTFTNGLPREKCTKCASLWFEGESLVNLVGTEAASVLAQRTKGKPGQCKHCNASLSYVAQCPRCGHDAPACPPCGTAPLAVAKVHGLRMDICPSCNGMALDSSGLERLQQIAAENRPRKPVVTTQELLKTLKKAPCSACQRKQLLKHTFTYDNKLYCGSCAPAGAAPFDIELARASPALAPALGIYLTGNEDVMADAVSMGITWLFKTAASHLLE